MRGLFKNMYLSNVQKDFSTFGLGLIALTTAAMLSACSDSDKTAGGGPSGTEAGNAITAQITVAGQPAAFARVKLSESESLDASESEFAEADSNGKPIRALWSFCSITARIQAISVPLLGTIAHHCWNCSVLVSKL